MIRNVLTPSLATHAQIRRQINTIMIHAVMVAKHLQTVMQYQNEIRYNWYTNHWCMLKVYICKPVTLTPQ